MKIAITYEEGKVFDHFGKAKQFVIYDVIDNEVIGSEVVDTDGSGHEAVANFLKSKNVDVVISGHMGVEAGDALFDMGIEAFTGAVGNTDDVVKQFLAETLESEGCNCGGGCGGDCGSEGGGCGSCGGGCGGCGGSREPLFEGKNVGKTIRAHYLGTFNDGVKFDSSYDRGEPLEFVCGAGMMILGFDKAVADMEVGDVKEVHLMPEEAYGPKNPNAIFTVNISDMPGCEELKAGDKAYLANAMGQPFPVLVADKTDTTITFDANHEMAGKELNFKIEIVEII